MAVDGLPRLKEMWRRTERTRVPSPAIYHVDFNTPKFLFSKRRKVSLSPGALEKMIQNAYTMTDLGVRIGEKGGRSKKTRVTVDIKILTPSSILPSLEIPEI